MAKCGVGTWIKNQHTGIKAVVIDDSIYKDGYLIRYPALKGPDFKQLIWVLSFQSYRETVYYYHPTVISRAVARLPFEEIYAVLGRRSLPCIEK